MKKRLRGILVTAAAGLSLGFLMFYPRVLDFGIGLGVALTILFGIGLLDVFGALRLVKGEAPPPEKRPFDLAAAPRWQRAIAGFDVRLLYLSMGLLVAALCRFSVAGTMGAGSPWSGPLLAVLAAISLIAARIRRKKRFDGDFHERFFVIVLATATLMATLGSQGLWDCWETHYGEVARRQLEQDDWIGMFWQNNWFFSKPILIFWMMNLGMALFGVRVTPDEISSHAEWGVRFFVALLAIAVIVGIYELLARRISRRAGIFSAIALMTMPMWAFMARQAITDLPFVGLMTLAVVFFLLGITVDPEKEAGTVRLPLGQSRGVDLSGFHALIAGYVAAGIPQFFYLATRSDRFRFGTLGRDDIKLVTSDISFLDGKLSDHVGSILGRPLGGAFDIGADWFVVGAAYVVAFLFILVTMRKERRIARLCFHGMYLALALSVMAKGLPGLVMPILGLFGYWVVFSPWSSIPRKGGVGSYIGWHWSRAKRLDLARGIPMFLLVASPWYLAMFLRHGMAFINRFFIHDHIKRLSVGVHGDTGTFEYVVRQFGYAAFPWIGLLPFALLAWHGLLGRRRPDATDDGAAARRKILVFVASWALLSFALFSMMVTKFHHYVFALVPPVAILVGVFIDDVWSGRVKRLGPVVLVVLSVLALMVADLTAPAGKGVLSGYTQLVGLFIYKYSRPYPAGPGYDISTEILVFGIAFAVSFALWLSPRIRKGAVAATLALALVFGHWLIQHHMVSLAPHWTQKHLIDEYYERRTSPAERLVAFQMNWKGENFYTGNRVVVHVSTKNKNFEKWVDKHRGERHFFITEYKRFGRMSKRADAASGPLEPFADTCNKYRAGRADEL